MPPKYDCSAVFTALPAWSALQHRPYIFTTVDFDARFLTSRAILGDLGLGERPSEQVRAPPAPTATATGTGLYVVSGVGCACPPSGSGSSRRAAAMANASHGATSRPRSKASAAPTGNRCLLRPGCIRRFPSHRAGGPLSKGASPFGVLEDAHVLLAYGRKRETGLRASHFPCCGCRVRNFAFIRSYSIVP